MMVGAYESIVADMDIDQLLESYPDFVTDMFAKSITSFGEFGGFITAEFIQWVWYLIIPAYLAMFCSGSVAGEVEQKTADILLSYPVSRKRFVAEKYLATLVPIGLITLMGFAAIAVGTAAFGISFELKWAAYAFAQSVPFLMIWTAAFTLMSTAVYDAKVVSTSSIALVFALYFADVIALMIGALKPIGYLSPMHYFDPGQAMSLNVVNVAGPVGLGIVALCLVGAAMYLFEVRDITG
jgi:ABC-2 type transport system permease protein